MSEFRERVNAYKSKAERKLDWSMASVVGHWILFAFFLFNTLSWLGAVACMFFVITLSGSARKAGYAEKTIQVNEILTDFYLGKKVQ